MNMTHKLMLLLVGLITSVLAQAGQITVNNGATLRGHGSITGDVEVNNGGTVQPMDGCLTVSNALFKSGSTLSVPIAGNTPCAGYGQLQVNGTVDLGDATLDAYTDGYSLQVLDEYLFVDNDANDGIVSPFNGLGEAGSYLIDGETLYASYFAGTGNDFSLVYKFIYSIGGNVSGLATGNSVFLQNGNDEIIEVAANGAYSFNDALDDGSAYNVAVTVQPSSPNQTCVVSNSSGNVNGGPVTNINVNCVTNSYSVGGNVLGLAAGNQVLLQNNAGDDLLLSANGAFNFNSAIDDGSAYDVTVVGQPMAPNQTCAVINSMGAVNGANVTDVVIQCVTNTYTIGGAVSGLAAGNSVTLQNNAGDDLSVSADGSFTFVTALVDESAYMVTVSTQPETPSQTCVVSNDSGNLAGANVTNVMVDCGVDDFMIGGVLNGLASGNSVVLQNNNGDDLTLNADGAFVFDTALPDKTTYDVTVLTQPTSPDQMCAVSNGSGSLAGDDVVDVNVTCTTVQYSVGGTLTGLIDGEALILEINNSEQITLTSDGPFAFPTGLDDGTDYEVEVFSEPTSPIQNCTIGMASGTINGDDVITVDVACDNLDLIFRDGVEAVK